MANLGTFLAGGATPLGNWGTSLLNGRMHRCWARSESAGKPPRRCWHQSSLCWRDALGSSLQLRHRSRNTAKPWVVFSLRPGPSANKEGDATPPVEFTSSKILTCCRLKVRVRAKKGIVSPLNLVSRANTKGQDWRGFVPLGPCEKPNVSTAWLFCTLEQTPTRPPSPHL